MFEKFTQDARMAVVEAQVQARAMNAAEIDTPHLLAGIAAVEPGDGAVLLTELGVSRADITADLDRIRRRGGVSDADAAALTELGIDVDRIVDAVEQTHGQGALAVGRTRPRRGHIPFSDRSKRTLELSLREAQGLGDDFLGPEHILLALARQQGTEDVLARRGVDYETLRGAVVRRRAS
ncbi:Clp protease N-terminal domain-containing protein [Amycolatopsis australiensis]|uniref:Clp amino terminal domain-containing protein, pathogenicity island component n=1 Tax=Amycolatopsis australiensis TaxID=546364 RepID=A0A1K1PN91_9PSEU|nr:Clp protease N-terminal domain-containing protein [Amycolatopsis australiensis]SFW49036.1 Clp amino terminal domain-containing protein, pathogenicity island component [Amycolatopsis australiensis]